MNINTYNLNLNQTASLIAANGHKRTVLVQGEMGIGKSSMLKELSRMFPDHVACYFDCTTKDLGDITIPDIAKLDDGSGYVQYLTNEELGVHNHKPIILMVDEFGKANPAVKNALLRLLLERKIGGYTLHPESRIFGTTNLGAEGVGDMLLPHHRNRLTMVTARKPNHIEWLEWGISNNIHPTLLSWVKDTPELFQSFLDHENPENNPYIYHPRAVGRDSFVTPRSLHAASDWMHSADEYGLDEQTKTAALIGTIGPRAAVDLAAYIALSDKLPRLADIKESPTTAMVPDSAAAICMVVFKALMTIDRSWVSAWMQYLNRLPMEAQALFCNGVRAPHYPHATTVIQNREFSDWSRDNQHLFSADKR